MNKIYKLVWSKTKNMYVAVCEFAKSHTKAPGSRAVNRTVVAGVKLWRGNACLRTDCSGTLR